MDARIAADVAVINKHFKENLIPPRVLFDVKGGNAGYVTSKDNHTIIHLNPGFFVKDEDEMVNCTTPHELAHWAEHKIYGGWERIGVRGKRSVHGRRWKKIMSVLGVDDSRTHSMDTTHVKRKTKKKYEYKCTGNCGATITVSSVVHNRILRGTHRYSCKCGGGLQVMKALGKVTYAQARDKRESQDRPTHDEFGLPLNASIPVSPVASKKVKAQAIFDTYGASPRSSVIQMFMDRLDMTKAGASTYYANCKKG